MQGRHEISMEDGTVHGGCRADMGGVPTFFAETPFSNIERMENNEELGRYTFTAVDAIGDEISCNIYLPNEWNIPQICLTAFVASRYRAADDAEAS